MTTKADDLVARVQRYIEQYVVFANPAYGFVAALWVLATHCFARFDAFPYVVITAPVKRCGKTRFAEVLSFLTRKCRRLVAPTSHSIFSEMPVVEVDELNEDAGDDLQMMVAGIESQAPVLFCDEAETLSKENASDMRAVLNSGYRKGGTVTRRGLTYPVFSPKVFILIGDVFDTLRDRSIVVEMWRGDPGKRFLFSEAQGEARDLKREIATAIALQGDTLSAMYADMDDLTFLTDRDAEIWVPLFVVAQLFCPARLPELRRAAVDLATLKTQEKRDYRALAGLEIKSEQHEYAVRLLNDLKVIRTGTETFIPTATAIERLKAIDIAPWRTFRGEGINSYNMADLLKPLGVAPVLARNGKKSPARGYRSKDIDAALKKL